MKHFPGSVIDKFQSPKARMNLVASRAARVKSVKRKMVGDLIREVLGLAHHGKEFGFSLQYDKRPLRPGER